MKQHSTKPFFLPKAGLLSFLITRTFKRIARWSLYLFAGILSWILFDQLPEAFIWTTIFTMLASMSIHAAFHQSVSGPDWLKQSCRFAFFLSFPVVFIFAGNRFASWSTTEEFSQMIIDESPSVTVKYGEVASEEYLLLKEYSKKGIQDPAKFKKSLKKHFGKQIKKWKSADKTARVLIIVLAVILLLVILLIVALLLQVRSATNTCLGGEDDSGCL